MSGTQVAGNTTNSNGETGCWLWCTFGSEFIDGGVNSRGILDGEDSVGTIIGWLDSVGFRNGFTILEPFALGLFIGKSAGKDGFAITVDSVISHKDWGDLGDEKFSEGLATVDTAFVETGVFWATVQDGDGDLQTFLLDNELVSGTEFNTVLQELEFGIFL